MTNSLNVKMRTRWTCPECGGSSRLVKSRVLELGPQLSTQQCREPACSWAGRAIHGARKTFKKSQLDKTTLERKQKANDMRRNPLVPQWVCPACGGSCIVRTSDTPLHDWRVVWMHCRDTACGWEGRGDYQVIETISPSGMPNPEYKRQMADSVPWRLPTGDLFEPIS